MDDLKLKKHVSYSQFSTFLKCPRNFYYDYVCGLKEYSDNLNTCFGSSIHQTIQLYIKTLYLNSLEEAESLNLFELFKEIFKKEVENKLKNKESTCFVENDYTDFIFDGQDILEEFTKTSVRLKNFPRDKYEFVDTELEIELPIKNNITFIAYLDLVLREKSTGDIKILDFKTSFNGWTAQKKDYTKISQLILYKAFYSKKFNIPLNKIDVEFFILKRKLYENVNYPQSRIQIFIPPNRNSDIVEAITTFTEFVTKCFTPDGQFIKNEKLYPKNPGLQKKNCKYCAHKKIRCDQKQEL